MRIASIDIGTNTLLLLIADVDGEGTLRVIQDELRFPRLGRDVDKSKMIRPPAFDRIAWVLEEYKNLSIQSKADLIIACGTSAVRDAANREEFLAYLRSTTGVEVQLLGGEEEARWSYVGALSGMAPRPGRVAVIDIGGGSTEVSYPGAEGTLTEGTPLNHRSFQLGSVRLTERCFIHNPPTSEEVESARNLVQSELTSLDELRSGSYSLIGVAGTVTTLACLDQGLIEFDVYRVSGYRLSREHVSDWFQRLSEMRSMEIEALSESTAGRADILTAGVLILLEFMNRFNFLEIMVSERGLRYGMVIREWEKQHRV
jgi:exopolyphosphatase / guanosine-5'-triphosphate,3'-diphosphate pyrophosphatase